MRMLDLLWLIPAVPLAGFAALAVAGGRLPRAAVAIIGAGSVGVSAALSFLLGASFIVHLPEGNAFVQTLWTWMSVGGFAPPVALRLDALSLVMILVVTGVGFLILMYSTEYMRDDKGYSRFFAYMNLFVSMMLILVLADNLALLCLGWEGVGRADRLHDLHAVVDPGRLSWAAKKRVEFARSRISRNGRNGGPDRDHCLAGRPSATRP